MNYKKHKLFSLFVSFSMSFAFSQTKEEMDKIMRSQDPKELSAFVKKYPNNPNVNFLNKRINNLSAPQSVAARPVIQPLNAKKFNRQAERKIESGKISGGEAEKTANLLNNLFSTDRNKSEVFLMIKNNSDCNLIVRVDGKKFFNLDIPKKGDNYLLVPKGTYKITTKICDASYQSTKNLTEDTQIILGIKK